jgi:hypothetical protein
MPPPADVLTREKGFFQHAGRILIFPIITYIGFLKSGMSKKKSGFVSKGWA